MVRTLAGFPALRDPVLPKGPDRAEDFLVGVKPLGLGHDSSRLASRAAGRGGRYGPASFFPFFASATSPRSAWPPVVSHARTRSPGVTATSRAIVALMRRRPPFSFCAVRAES